MRKLYLFLFLAVCAVSCSKDDDKAAEPAVVLSDSDLKLHYDDTHQFTLTQGTTPVMATTFKWTSSDTIVGKVDQSGKFAGRRIGQTTIKAVSTDGKTTLQSKVTIDPYSTLCVEPVLDFKATQAAVKAKEKRTVLAEDTSVLGYQGENAKLRGVLYLFEKNALQTSVLLFTETNAIAEEAADFLQERYEYVGQDGEVFILTDGKVALGFTQDETLGLAAIYLPFSESGLRVSGNRFQTLKAVFKSELKSVKSKFKGF
jgi:hypothetical protein